MTPGDQLILLQMSPPPCPPFVWKPVDEQAPISRVGLDEFRLLLPAFHPLATKPGASSPLFSVHSCFPVDEDTATHRKTKHVDLFPIVI